MVLYVLFVYVLSYSYPLYCVGIIDKGIRCENGCVKDKGIYQEGFMHISNFESCTVAQSKNSRKIVAKVVEHNIRYNGKYKIIKF